MSEDKKFEEHDLGYLPVESIQANAWNPQEQDAATFERLVKEVEEIGFIDPIEVVPLENGLYRIIGGEHRWEAAKRAGMPKVPCIILRGPKWQEEDLQKFVTVRLNVLKGKLDPHKFAVLFQEMAAKYGEDALQNLMGFTDQKAFQRVLKGVQKGIKQSLPKEMAEKFDAAAKDAKSVEDLGNIVQNLFAQYGDTVQHSFMVFTYGKREHIYVQMDKKMRKAMDKVVEFCRVTGEDINALMGPVLDTWMQEAVTRLEQSETNKPDKNLNDSEEEGNTEF